MAIREKSYYFVFLCSSFYGILFFYCNSCGPAIPFLKDLEIGVSHKKKDQQEDFLPAKFLRLQVMQATSSLECVHPGLPLKMEFSGNEIVIQKALPFYFPHFFQANQNTRAQELVFYWPGDFLDFRILHAQVEHSFFGGNNQYQKEKATFLAKYHNKNKFWFVFLSEIIQKYIFSETDIHLIHLSILLSNQEINEFKILFRLNLIQ